MAQSTLAGLIRRFTAASYAFALLAVASADGLWLALGRVLGGSLLYLTFFAAILFTARLAGRGPGLLATALGSINVWYLFLHPRYSFGLTNGQDAICIGIFTLIGIAVSLMEPHRNVLSVGDTGRGIRPERNALSNLRTWRRLGMVGSAALGLGILASLLSAGLQRSIDAEHWIEHTYQVLDAESELRSSLGNAETAARGYLFTGDDRYRQLFQAALAAERKSFDTLRALTLDNRFQQARLDQCEPLVQTGLGRMTGLIEGQRRQGGRAAAAEVELPGNVLSDQVAEILGAVEQEEHRLLQSRTKAARDEDSRTRWILGLGSGSLIVLLLVAGALIERHMQLRQLAEMALDRQARLIDFSHDAIITADGNHVIRGWNLGAEQMYGWTAAEAVGKVMNELLKTHADTSIAERLAILVRDGRWEGEMNHRTRDGRERLVESRQVLLRDERDHAIGVLEINRDVTERKKAEDALRQSESRLRSLSDSLPEAAIYQYRQDTGGKAHFDFISAGIERLTGVPAAEFMSDKAAVDRTIVPEDSAALDAALARSRDTLTRFEFELRHKHRVTGETRWSMLRSTPARNPDGSTTWDGIELDITERKRMEDALRLSEEKFARAFATNPAAITMTRLEDGRFVDVNETWQELVGYSRNEAVGRTSLDLKIWPTSEDRLPYANELRTRGFLTGWEQTLLSKSGAPIVVLISAEILTIGGEELVLSACVDITQRKLADEAVRESEEQFRTLANAIPQLCWMADADGWIFWYNDRWFEYTGCTPEQMQGWGWKSVHDPDALPNVLERWNASIATGEPFDMVFPLRGADGVFRPFLTRVMPVRDREGKVARWFGTNTDVSEQRRTEDELRQKSEQLRTVLEAGDLGAWEFRLDTGEVFWDESCCHFSGLPVTSHVDYQQTYECLHPDDRAATADAVQQALDGANDGRYSKEFRVVWPDGSVHWIASHGRVYFDQQSDGNRAKRFIGVMMDITDRKRADEALRESQAKLEAALSAMTDAVFISDAHGHFVHFNDAFATFHRFNSKEQCSRRLDDYPAILEIYSLDGKLMPLDLWAVPRALRGETSTNSEFGLRRKDTGEAWIGSYSYGPIRDQHGIIVGSVVVVRDVTEQKQAEEEIRRLNSELEQRVLDRTAQLEASNKELEAFAYSVSHDLRAPLRGIDGWSLALMEDYGDRLEARAMQYLDRVRSETQRMGNLIDDLLQLSRIARAEMRRDTVDLSAIVESITSRLREAHPRRHLEFAIQPGLTAYGDARLLDVALTNLLENAVKFTHPRDLARIEFARVSVAESAAFVVRDNGVGFDMAYANQLFGAFQRLHSNSEFPGTGIGLATVQRVLRRHGGRIWAQAEPGLGAAFFFTIGDGDIAKLDR
jgi:PAS domain S-box-containing protein